MLVLDAINAIDGTVFCGRVLWQGCVEIITQGASFVRLAFSMPLLGFAGEFIPHTFEGLLYDAFRVLCEHQATECQGTRIPSFLSDVLVSCPHQIYLNPVGGCGGNCKLIVGYLGLYEYCPTSRQKDQIGLQTRIVPLGLRGLSVGVTFTLERTQILVCMKCGCGASLVWAHEV